MGAAKLGGISKSIPLCMGTDSRRIHMAFPSEENTEPITYCVFKISCRSSGCYRWICLLVCICHRRFRNTTFYLFSVLKNIYLHQDCCYKEIINICLKIFPTNIQTAHTQSSATFSLLHKQQSTAVIRHNPSPSA